MKIVLDSKMCLKHKLTMEEALIALALRGSKSYVDTFENLIKREILVYKDEKYYITQHWSDVIDEVLADSSGKVTKTDDELIALAVRLQECFPKAKMRDRFGRETPFYYRCNKTEIKNALKRFFTYSSYKNASDDEIIDATRRYVASFKGNYSGKMRLAKYFVWKNDIKLKEDGTGYIDQLSDLETFLENKESDDVTTSDDWMITAKN